MFRKRTCEHVNSRTSRQESGGGGGVGCCCCSHRLMTWYRAGGGPCGCFCSALGPPAVTGRLRGPLFAGFGQDNPCRTQRSANSDPPWGAAWQEALRAPCRIAGRLLSFKQPTKNTPSSERTPQRAGRSARQREHGHGLSPLGVAAVSAAIQTLPVRLPGLVVSRPRSTSLSVRRWSPGCGPSRRCWGRSAARSSRSGQVGSRRRHRRSITAVALLGGRIHRQDHGSERGGSVAARVGQVDAFAGRGRDIDLERNSMTEAGVRTRIGQAAHSDIARGDQGGEADHALGESFM